MNDLPRKKLAELVAKYGRELCDDPRRCKALLRDVCGQYKKENFILISAAEERIAADLATVQNSLPKDVLLARLTRRMHDDLSLPEDLARWGVESWALALGVVDGSQVSHSFTCPACKASGWAPATLAGKLVHCPKCRAGIRVSADLMTFTLEGSPKSVVQQRSSGPVANTPGPTSSRPPIQTEGLFEQETITTEDLLRHALRRAMAHGTISNQEKSQLRQLRQSLGINPDVAARLAVEAQAELASQAQTNSTGVPPSISQPIVHPTRVAKPPKKRSRAKRLFVCFVLLLFLAGAGRWLFLNSYIFPDTWTEWRVDYDPHRYSHWLSQRLAPKVVEAQDQLYLLSETLSSATQLTKNQDDTEIETFRDRLSHAYQQALDENHWPLKIAGLSLEEPQAKALLDRITQYLEKHRDAIESRNQIVEKLKDGAAALQKERDALQQINGRLDALSSTASPDLSELRAVALDMDYACRQAFKLKVDTQSLISQLNNAKPIEALDLDRLLAK